MSSPVTKITDHAARFAEDTLSQFVNSPKIKALIAVFAAEVQRLEDLLWKVLTDRLIDAATGDILDRIGGIVRVRRLGRTDADYRPIIKVAIAARNSEGGAEEIVRIAEQLVGETVQYIREDTAHFRLQYLTDEELGDDFLAEALELIGLSVPAGVSWVLVAGDETDGMRFDEGLFDEDRFGTVVGEDQ
jgi:hypothetical protein